MAVLFKQVRRTCTVLCFLASFPCISSASTAPPSAWFHIVVLLLLVLHFAQFLQQIPFCTTIELSSARAFPLLKNSHHGDAGLLSIPAAPKWQESSSSLRYKDWGPAQEKLLLLLPLLLGTKYIDSTISSLGCFVELRTHDSGILTNIGCFPGSEYISKFLHTLLTFRRKML